MKKTLKSQLIVAITMTLIATVALTSATYAWFTSIANPEVNSINLYVKAADNLMLSAYDNSTTPAVNLVSDWKSSILQTDIENPAYQTGDKWGAQSAAFPANMFNVSTLFTADSNKFYSATFNPLGAINGYVEADQTNYSKFSLWVKSTRTGEVVLKTTPVTGSAVTTPLNNTAPKNAIADTVRIGFVPIKNGTEDWANASVWEPNYDQHLDASYGGTATAGYNPTTSAVDGLTTTSLGTQTTIYTPGADIPILNIDNSTYNVDSAINFDVYIWVEGSDGDAQPAVAKSNFQTYLQFGQNP